MTLYFSTVILGTALLFSACKKDEAKTEAPAAEPAAEAPAEVPAEVQAESPPSADETFAKAVMTPYEECRALLADDKAEIADCAKAIASAATELHPKAPEAAKAHLTAIATAAEALAGVPADDMDALRLAFGDTSKPVVALLRASPESAKSYHLFECPMAKGYQRWVQPDAKLANPYMGARMLACGTEIHDHQADQPEHGHDHEDGHMHE